MFKNRKVAILAFIMVVNALSYGTIIPLLYPYAARFGITPLGMGLLFTSFSITQFFATPILGRLSDRFGRKPIMMICLLGTALSLAVFAMAQSVAVLFIARMIDGITGGNASVAQAIISDSTEGEERAKSFGVIWAAFGFGFLFGPAIGGILSGYALTAPFWMSAALAVVATILCYFLLPETLKPEMKARQNHEPLFKLKSIFQALFLPYTGILLFISFMAASAMNAMILGFQAFTLDVLHLNTTQIGLFFSGFGLIGIIMQMGAIGPILKKFPSKKNILRACIGLSGITMLVTFFSGSVIPFFISMMTFAAVGAFRDPMISALLSERTKAEDQGGIMGINQSYISLGQIFGPLAAGLVTTYSIHYTFLLAAVLLGIAYGATRWLYLPVKKLDL